MLCLPFLCSGGLEMAWHPCFLPTQTSFYPPFLSSLLPSAEEMLERALYGLEMAWHPSFAPAAASMHVPYEEANAPLFICLFRWVVMLAVLP